MARKKSHPIKPCKNCGRTGHYAINCYNLRRPSLRQRKPLRLRSQKEEERYGIFHKKWHAINPPNAEGFWVCYLQISKGCPKVLTYEELQLEHVFPRSKYPELKYVLANVKAACAPCNKLKRSNTIYQMALFYPRLAELINSPEWFRLVAELGVFSSQLQRQVGPPPA
jgi:5-methylcytosine-specific restriction endonuclease McrA